MRTQAVHPPTLLELLWCWGCRGPWWGPTAGVLRLTYRDYFKNFVNRCRTRSRSRLRKIFTVFCDSQFLQVSHITN